MGLQTKDHGLVTAVVLPAPHGSAILGPAVLDADGNRIGQLAFQKVKYV